ncbi:MAG: serine/threonine protein kinase [Pirellulales bacterium]|nr:serine/threonine protein kinase [Pirellulales bacterium]
MTDATPNVPDFMLIRPIGEGGFGRVWLAVNETTGRLRAIKLIPLAHNGHRDAAGREIASLTRLEKNTPIEHTNLLKIDHVGRTEEYLFYVMDPADDSDGSKAENDPGYRPATLQHKLEQGHLMSEECFANTRAILSGLAALHKQDMVHRDVKPANCLFVDGTLKLADFGLLTVADAYTSRVGTEAYMPPDGRMDTRADVYAAGLVIYEMLTGRPADNFPQLGERARDITDCPILQRLNHLALLACRRDPEDRYADAQEMLAALEVPDTEKVSPPRDRVAARSRIAAGLGLLTIIVFATMSFFASQQWTPTPKTVEVRFTSTPEHSLILIDGELLLAPDGSPQTTPCTVDNISPEPHQVIFRTFGRPDYDAGVLDFAEVQEVRALWD